MELCKKCVNKECKCRDCEGGKWKNLCPEKCKLQENETCIGFEGKDGGRYCADCDTYIGPDEWHCSNCGGPVKCRKTFALRFRFLVMSH